MLLSTKILILNSYVIWTFLITKKYFRISFIAYKTGYWVYPILEKLPMVGRAAFICGMAILAFIFYLMGEKLNTTLWGTAGESVSFIQILWRLKHGLYTVYTLLERMLLSLRKSELCSTFQISKTILEIHCCWLNLCFLLSF